MRKDYIENIKYGLLNILGLSIMNNMIFDDDAETLLIYNEGFIKMNGNGIIHSNDNIYDPVFDAHQTKYFFGICINKESRDNSLYVQTMGVDSTPILISEDTKRMQYSLNIDTQNGSIRTNYYFNLCLCYIEAIYRLTGIYDIDPSLKEKLKLTDYDVQDLMEHSYRYKGDLV